MRRALVLFTCDLRVRDNTPLAAAIAASEEIVPAFVLDERLLATSCGAPNRLAFLRESLRDLDASLRARGAGLLVRRGDVVEQALALAHRFRAEAIYISADTTPYARERHNRLARACREQRVELIALGTPSAVAPGTVVPVGGGGHYRVFTPYWRAWRALPLRAAAPAPRRIAAPRDLPAMRLPALPSCGRASRDLPHGGESAGREQLARFLARHLASYGERHDDLAGDATSKLSPYLHFGCLSAGAVIARADGREGAEEFARQLCWRDFHRQVLADRPDMASSDYRPRQRPWRRDRNALGAWREGLTGLPIVDAGMRQLAREGWMHNRARLIVASLLTKTLRIDWRPGASHFAALLCDADVADNAGNWQWVAGTGNDTRPNRVLNPLRQARHFDPDGAYVRRYVPELAALPGAAVHEPWRLAGVKRAQLRYPHPIVDPGTFARG
jgi:deoxyribodipyrimidine photo-lyase